MKQMRQGDVLLQKVSELPNGCEEIKGEVILAYGEVTGHAHAIRLPETERSKVRYWNAGAERFLQVIERVALTHEEHAPIVIEKGVYRQGFQVEDFGSEVRRVAD
jgi:hypothetical protein